jgi:hypothetical protein
LAQAGKNLAKIYINRPDGKREVKVPESGDFVLPAMEKVGLYSTGPAIPGYEHIAVNVLDANESNVAPGQIPGVDPQRHRRRRGRTRPPPAWNSGGGWRSARWRC